MKRRLTATRFIAILTAFVMGFGFTCVMTGCGQKAPEVEEVEQVSDAAFILAPINDPENGYWSYDAGEENDDSIFTIFGDEGEEANEYTLIAENPGKCDVVLTYYEKEKEIYTITYKFNVTEDLEVEFLGKKDKLKDKNAEKPAMEDPTFGE